MSAPDDVPAASLPESVIDSTRKALSENHYISGKRFAGEVVIDLIIPIHNAFDQLVICLASVARHTDTLVRLILINDGSSDPRISTFLSGLAGVSPHLLVLDRSDNRGFAATVNEGFAFSTTDDVVILNSDTIVSRGWLRKMAAIVAARSNVATVTPLTNNGTLCSVPIPFQSNPLPAGYDVDSFAALIEKQSLRIYPDAPTGVGFCMLITRRALFHVGPFDEATFGRGYGEENDFCQRAIQKGFSNLIADDTFVFHEGRASFGDASEGLLAGNLARLWTLHPRYGEDVAGYIRDHPLRFFHLRLQDALAGGRPAEPDVRVLHLLHGTGGGTERHARDLAETRDPRVRSFVLTSDGATFTVDSYYTGERVDAFEFPLAAPVPGDPLRHAPDYGAVLASICSLFDINLLHVHHLINHTVDVADIAAERRIPFVVTLHDYYVVCPSYTLINADGNVCLECREHRSGEITAACMRRLGKPDGYLDEHQRSMHAFLSRAARLFAPSDAARRIVERCYPYLSERLAVVEHGHRFAVSERQPRTVVETGTAPRLNVAILGALPWHKGLDVFRDVLRLNRRQDITFHMYGVANAPDLNRSPGTQRELNGSTFVYEGPYDSAHIVERLQRDAIDVGLQPAIWPETFSFTLSEFVAAGVPVIAGDLGAPGDRVRKFSLGWIVPDARDAQAVVALLDRLAEHPEEIRRAAQSMRREEAVRTRDAMWIDYLSEYRRVIVNAAVNAAPVATDLKRSDVMHIARRLRLADDSRTAREKQALMEGLTEGLTLKMTNQEFIAEKARIEQQFNVEKERMAEVEHQLRDELRVLYSSRSWQLTAPLRGLFDLLSRSKRQAD